MTKPKRITTNDRALGEQIARWRQDANMTQQELANAVGSSISYIGKMEIGQKHPSMDLLTQMVVAMSERYMDDHPGAHPFDLNQAYMLANYPQVAAPVRFYELVQVLRRATTVELPTMLRVLEAFTNEPTTSETTAAGDTNAVEPGSAIPKRGSRKHD